MNDTKLNGYRNLFKRVYIWIWAQLPFQPVSESLFTVSLAKR